MNNIKQDIIKNNILTDYYINFSNCAKTDEFITFESKFSTYYEKPIEYIDDKILSVLVQLKSEHVSLLKSRLVYNQKLQRIADESGITRERVRQLESQAIKRFLVKIDKSLVSNIINMLSNNPMIFLDDLPIKNNELKILLCEILSHKEFKKAIFDRDLMCLVKDNDFSFTGVLNKIEDYIEKSVETIFSKKNLINALQLLLPKVENIEKLILVLEQNKIVKNVNNDQYFFPFLYKTKRPMLEFIFSLYPDGLELHREVEFIYNELNKYFLGIFKEDDKKRAIITIAGYSDQILLWDWGRYLHIKYIRPILEEYDFSLVLDYIDEHLNNTQIDLQSCFNEFENELIGVGIISKYALHTCLKIKYPDEYAYQDAPWISKAGTERSELKQTIKNLLIEDRNYSLDELVELMHSSKVRVQQLIENSKDIIQVEQLQYKSKQFIEFDQHLFGQIVQFTNDKVKELDFIYIDLIIDEFSKELDKYNKFDIRMMLIEMFKKYSCEKNFNISNTRLIEKNYPITRDSLNFHILLENLFKDKEVFSINDIAKNFIKRGLSKDRIMMYYLYSKIKKIVRIDKEIFVSLDKVGLSQNDIKNINLILDEKISDEIHINDIINNYALPKILTKWNNFILTDMADYSKFVFYPSRENPIYIKKK